MFFGRFFAGEVSSDDGDRISLAPGELKSSLGVAAMLLLLSVLGSTYAATEVLRTMSSVNCWIGFL